MTAICDLISGECVYSMMHYAMVACFPFHLMDCVDTVEECHLYSRTSANGVYNVVYNV